MVSQYRLDRGAAAFFLVATGIVVLAPWMEVYVEESVEGLEQFLLVENFTGLKAGSGVAAAFFATVAAGFVLIRQPLLGFWTAVLAFCSSVFTYALLHSTLAAELAPERKQELAPGWGISANLLWSGVGLALLFAHLWGDALWAKLCGASDSLELDNGGEEEPATSKATLVVALILVLLMVIFLWSADPDDKIWKRMMR
jgi:hypothetical protein